MSALAATLKRSPPRTISLVLGSGGARGYAHIGAIEELRAQGFDIRSVAGASMGALVGGIYAAGQLDALGDYARELQRLDVLRLMDLTVTGGGFIKGDRVLDEIKSLIGDVCIEQLPIHFTAVAVDLYAQREVWFSQGPLFDAIRASISIPTVFRPHRYAGMTLVDGGLLDPMPVSAVLHDATDCTIAIDVNAPAEPLGGEAMQIEAFRDTTFGSLGEAFGRESAAVAMPPSNVAKAPASARRGKIAAFIDGVLERGEKRFILSGDPNAVELFACTLDAVQETITRFKLAAHPPDLLIRIPRNVCAFYEFHRADEVIELGRQRTRAALRQWQALAPAGSRVKRPGVTNAG